MTTPKPDSPALADDQWDYDPGDDDDLFDEEPWQDCGLGDDGQCSQAGSEWCDFECPYRDSEDFAGSAAWHEKHEKKDRAK